MGPSEARSGRLSRWLARALEEAGEVASAIRGLEGFKTPEKMNTKEMLATELSDVLFMVFVLAEHYGIELEESFMQTTNDRFMSML